MRNKYPGPCMRCGKLVAVGTGHPQLQSDGLFKVHHANFAGDGRVTCEMVKDEPAFVPPPVSYVPCMGKQTFESYEDANRAAKRTRENGYGNTMHAYRCAICKQHHVGHDVIGKPTKFRFKQRRK